MTTYQKVLLQFILCATLFPAVCYAQNSEITGTVQLDEGEQTHSVVIYLKGNLPAAQPLPPAVMEQRNKQFVPDLLVITKGTQVSFPNLDKIFHNVFSPTTGNQFDLGLYREGESRTVVFQTSGLLDVYCNVHERMMANILVLDNEFYTRPAEDGTYRIVNVPPGKYTIVGWLKGHLPDEHEITISSSASPATSNFVLPKPLPMKKHTNKEGLPYGRYK